jgi:hypothetical protein
MKAPKRFGNGGKTGDKPKTLQAPAKAQDAEQNIARQYDLSKTPSITERNAWNKFLDWNANTKGYSGDKALELNKGTDNPFNQLSTEYNNPQVLGSKYDELNSKFPGSIKVSKEDYVKAHQVTPEMLKNAQSFYKQQTQQDARFGSETAKTFYPEITGAAFQKNPNDPNAFTNKNELAPVSIINYGDKTKTPFKAVAPVTYDQTTGKPTVDYTKARDYTASDSANVYVDPNFKQKFQSYLTPSVTQTTPVINNTTQVPAKTPATTTPSLTGLKKGGLIASIRGYDDGGVVYDASGKPVKQNVQVNTTQQAPAAQSGGGGNANAIVGAAGTAIDLTTGFIDAKDLDPETGLYGSKTEAAAIGGLRGAAKGASAGASFGLPGILVGAGLGALAGGGTGYIKEKRGEDAIASAKDGAMYNANRLREQQQFQNSLNGQLQQRQEGYSEGGKIVGKGGPKEDKILAKVKGSSFVVPAKNADIAEEIREKILSAPSLKKKADLNQKGGEKIKLSNGEHLFTPEEKKEIDAKLGEGFLDLLAPDADNKNSYSDGGKTKGSKRQYRGDTVTYDGNNWITADGNIKYKGDIFDEEIKKETEKKSQEDSKYKSSQVDALKRHYDFIKDKPDRKAEAERTLAKLNGYSSTSKIPTKTGAEINKIAGGKSAPKVVTKTTPDVMQPKTTTELPTDNKEQDIIPSKEIKQGGNQTPPASDKTGMGDAKKQGLINAGLGIAQQVGGLANYVLPYKQYQLGNQFLTEAGARPTGQIDPGFQSSVTRANANAKYGWSPEEQAANNQQNLSALRAQQAAAQNYSGGSAGNAYVMSRQASNDYFGRGLQNAVANKNLQMNKQQYADQLNAEKAAMSRQLFQDNLNSWTAKQQSGSALLGAGISNIMGAKRYNDELNFQRQYTDGENNWTKTIGQ